MSETPTQSPHERCPSCGSSASASYGPDYRFNPPCSNPKMWTAQCGGSCFDLSLTWTAFTRERALELWDSGIRAVTAQATGSQQT